MDEFERDLENYLVELDGSSFPLDEDIFLEDAESCCSTLSSKFDDLSDEEDVDEGFAVHPMGKVKINMVVLRIICPAIMMMCMPKCLECKRSP